MKKVVFSVILCASVMPVGARTILTPTARADYESRISTQKSLASRLSLHKASEGLEREALQFLYAYMPTSDVLDYSDSFYLENIRTSLEAASEMPWGDKVPDREWRHFVLPVRVNNENLDLSRPAFYAELRDRVRNLSMAEAILEVNHWCHEKVAYQPSDARTSSPLATVCNALGRCGEESTFTVAALRSVGIPARQVYTPRWAHTDDNHAWVEAWADGKWHFIGACEPEAVLDLAWFNAPASRGMLMNTKVTGAYDGPEEVLSRNANYTQINVTSNYAPVDVKRVLVYDVAGQPVKGAKVNFSLYNYAEFYPVAVRTTDSRGYVELTAGLGDMIVWASDGSRFGLAKTENGDTLRLTLDKDASFRGTLSFDIVPPHQSSKLPVVDPVQADINEQRKSREDSIRAAYTSTFISPDLATGICRDLSLPDEAAELIVKSRGNHRVIVDFLRRVSPGLRKKAVTLLSVVSEKDLHDITPEVLDDHLATPDLPTPLFAKYVLSPRVENEMLTPWRSFLRSHISDAQALAWRRNPRLLEKELKDRIEIDSVWYPVGFRTSPAQTWISSVGDPLSRSILFVAMARSIGIPARIDPVTHSTQFADNSGNWCDVFIGVRRDDSPLPKGKLTIDCENVSREPSYLAQFTISKIEEGMPVLYEFGDFEPLSSVNSRSEALTAGQYALVSGQRLADGSVLALTRFFGVIPEIDNRVALEIRQDTSALQVIGSLDAETLFRPLDSDDKVSLISQAGRGYYVVGIVKPGHEPSAHAMNDISVAAELLEATGRKLIILFPDEEAAARFVPSDYGPLPSNVILGVDSDSAVSHGLRNGLQLSSEELPVVAVADSFNRIVYVSQGYTIHLGENLAKILERLRE